MKEVPVKLGPLALLLTVISICLTTMAILTFTTARADRNLAQKFADTVKDRYQLELQGQSFLARLHDDLSRGFSVFPDPDGVLRETISHENSRLHIELLPDGENGFSVRNWRIERPWEEDTNTLNLWDGS